MQHHDLSLRSDGWTVLGGTERSQAAMMTLDPGERTGGADNTHDADQWLYVISGKGIAVVAGREQPIGGGSLLLIEAGEPHEIRAESTGPLRTVNVYAPPAY